MTISKKWNWEKLGDAVQVLDNLRKPINSSERQKRIANKSTNELFPYYGATGQVGWIDNFITSGEYVLVGEDGAPFLDNFKEKAYKIKGKTWVNNHAHILKQKEGITINDFILHYLNSINYRQYVNGTTRLKLTKGSLVEIPFPVPSIDTQQAIVSKIEELFSEIENGIKSLFTAKEQLKKYRQSVLKWAFEGKLTNGLNGDLYDLPDEHDLSIAAEPETEYRVQRNHKNQKNQKNHSSDKGELPEGWKWMKLGDVIEKPKYGTSKKCDYTTNGIGVLRIPNIVKGMVDSSDLKFAQFDVQELETYGLKEGDILTIRSNGSVDIVGKCALVRKMDEQFLYAGYLIRLRAIQKMLLPKYLANIFSSINIRNQIEKKAKSTSGVNNINSQELAGLIIPLPSIQEQHKIIEAIESRLSVADKMKESITESLQQAEALKQSILKKAFEGKLI